LSVLFKHMQFLRKPILVLTAAILPILLFATAFDFGVLRVVGSPIPVKKILSDSGIYGSVVSGALDQAQKTSSAGGEVTLTDPAIKKAAQESFSPQVVQNSSEKVIDGIYNWLDGKTAQPDFNVDLTNVKTTFAEKIGQAATDRAAALPKCTAPPASTDPFSVTCLPPSLTPAQVGEQAKNDVLTGQGFLDHPDITASSVKSSNGQPLFEKAKLQNAPKQYQRAKKTPFILAILSILAILAVIFLSATRKIGLRRIGMILTIIGALMLLFAWGINRVATHNVIPKLGLDNNVLRSSVQKLATEIVHNVQQNYIMFGGIYLALGIAALIISMMMGKKTAGEKVPANTDKSAPAANSSTTPKPAQKPAPKPKPKSSPRIQG
jgi:hypothetical protein